MTLDLASEAGRTVLLARLAEADVLIENFKTGTLEKWGLGHDALAARFPRLVHVRVSGFGADGPLGGLPGYDAALQALTGIMSINGEADSPPLRVGREAEARYQWTAALRLKPDAARQQSLQTKLDKGLRALPAASLASRP